MATMLVSSIRHHALSPSDDRPVGVRAAAAARSLLARGHQVFCGLRGHGMMLRFEPDRLSLRCFDCGAETPGWPIDVSPQLRLRRPRVDVRVTGRSNTVDSAFRHRRGRDVPASTRRAA